MPFKSKAQQAYMYLHADKLKRQGVDLKEWSAETDFKSLPKKAALDYGQLLKRQLARRHDLSRPDGQAALAAEAAAWGVKLAAESQFERGMKEETEEHHLPPAITAKLVLDHLLKKKYYRA